LNEIATPLPGLAMTLKMTFLSSWSAQQVTIASATKQSRMVPEGM